MPLGGVGIFLAVHITVLFRSGPDYPLLLASSIVLILGLADDRRSVRPTARLGVETLAAVVLVVATSSPDAGLPQGLLGVALVIFAINSVNLLDGLDGLAASVALVTASGLAFLAAGRGIDPSASWELAAALAGFLAFNWHPAKVFLGDSGAYVVGLTLAYLVLDIAPGGAVPVLVTAGVFGVFAVDLIVTLLRRWQNGRPLFAGDRSHVYDQLRDHGMSTRRIALIAAATQAILVGAVVAADQMLGQLQALAALALLLALLVGVLAWLGFLRVDVTRSTT